MSDQPPAEVEYLIWSNQHRAWWAPAECGYTTVLEAAGRYSHADAAKIVAGATLDGTLRRQYWVAERGAAVEALDEWMVAAPPAGPPD
jgi:hypothetical protein